MKFFAVFALFVAAAVAVPVDINADGQAQILRYDSDNNGTPEGYNYIYVTSNGIKANEQGTLKNVGQSDVTLEVRGAFSYIGVDGKIYTLTYTANEFGFQPSAEHLPQA